MAKVKSLDDLKAIKESLHSKLDIREKSNNPESFVQIKIAMATCGIAAGAKQLMDYMMDKADNLNIEAVFTQSGCMGHCQAEPTVEVIIPGKTPVIFGSVDKAKADAIFEKYIKNNESIDGILPNK